MLSRPKRSVSRLDYRQLADVKIPKVNSSPDSTLYCLRVLKKTKRTGKLKCDMSAIVMIMMNGEK